MKFQEDQLPARKSDSAVTPQVALKLRARGQLSGLLSQLILGMAVNLIGGPNLTPGAAKIAISVFLILHVIIAIGLVVGAILAAVNARRAEPKLARLGWIGLAVIIVTFSAGVVTLITNSGWWSFLMAAGATASLVIYGVLFMRPAQSTAQIAAE